jgi:hypothetical protein
MMFLKGFITGFAGIAVYMLAFNYSLAALLRKNPKFPKLLYAISYLIRYAVLGAGIYFFLIYKIGSPLGLLAGIIAGTAGYAHLRISKIKGQAPTI